MPRTILVILSNRFNRTAAPLYFEIDCEDNGDILDERLLPEAPESAGYAEVWENDEGRSSIDDCVRMRRHYKHKYLKPAE